jgi:uncharacterized protein
MTNADKKLEKPLPRPAPESRAFWDGAKAKKLMLPRCDACGAFWFPPSERCPHCLSTSFQWLETKGEGRIYSFVVYHRVYHPAFEADVPYVVAIVELDEGPRLLTNIVDAPEKVRCDARVRVKFVEAGEDIVLPKFALLT